MSVHVCTNEDMHPYTCDVRACRHCDRRDDATHDPGVCALCDPEYDFQPNPYWKRRARRRVKAWAACAAQMLLGHASPATTELYLHSDLHKALAVDALQKFRGRG